MSRFRTIKIVAAMTLAASLAMPVLVAPAVAANVTLLNVSYDPTRELYKDFNPAFAAYWKQKTGDSVSVRMSHGGSGAQARSVIDGLEADVVTLALEADISAIAEKTGKIPPTGKPSYPAAAHPIHPPSSFWCARAIRRASRTGPTSPRMALR